jgi:hypothetical protein
MGVQLNKATECYSDLWTADKPPHDFDVWRNQYPVCVIEFKDRTYTWDWFQQNGGIVLSQSKVDWLDFLYQSCGIGVLFVWRTLDQVVVSISLARLRQVCPPMAPEHMTIKTNHGKQDRWIECPCFLIPSKVLTVMGNML